MPPQPPAAEVDVTQTITWGNPTAQFGNSNGALWQTRPFDALSIAPLSLAGDNEAGVIFDAALQQTLRFDVLGNLLDSPILTAFTLRADYLRFAGVANPQVEVLLVQDPRPADYSDAALPLERGEASLGIQTLALGGLGSITSQDFVFDAAGIMTARTQVVGRARWQGRFALTIAPRTVGSVLFLQNTPTNPLRLFTVQEPFFAGIVGGPAQGKTRVVRDYRYGMPAFREELVRDGDN
ncbi:MAG: hypothetical protein L0191_06390, partial [Acidobacteria bacterium]|nr:hypothetical protein [Acidobacteriota bacterium]